MRTGALASILVTSLLLLGAATACSSGDDPSASANTSNSTTQLAGRVFLLQAAVGYVPVAGTVIRLSFTATNLSFSAGCNSHSGLYEIRNGTLVAIQMSSTEMGCDAALHTQDEWLAAFFASSPTWTLNGDTLTLTSGDVVLTFLDREVAEPDRPLVGPTWTVDTLISGDMASSIMSTLQQPSVSFGDDGSLLVDTGCNTGSGSYTATTTNLAFVGVSFTASTCTDSAASSMLGHLATVFADGTATYSIEAALLRIDRGDLGIMARANE